MGKKYARTFSTAGVLLTACKSAGIRLEGEGAQVSRGNQSQANEYEHAPIHET
jgi:hypothetical protein